MKSILSALIALVLTSSLLAGIGDTKEKVIASGKSLNGDVQLIEATADYPAAVVAVFPDETAAVQVLNSKGVVQATGATMPRIPTAEELAELIDTMYPGVHWKYDFTKGDVVHYHATNRDWVLQVSTSSPIILVEVQGAEKYAPRMAQALVGTIKPSQPQQPEAGAGPQDCLITATETYNRLKAANIYWVEIVGLKVTLKNGNHVGHAVVVFKWSENDRVYMYDRTGAMELDVTSTDADLILNSINRTRAWPVGMDIYEIVELRK